MAHWKAGAAEVVVTPPVGGQLEGYGGRDAPSTNVHDNLYAHALVLDDGTTRIGIVTVDIIGVDRHMARRVRSEVAERTGIAPDNLMLIATHTHGGPRGLIELRTTVDKALIEVTARQIAGAVATAAARLRPATLLFGTGRVDGVSQNRRFPDGPTDPVLHALRVNSEDGAPIAVLVRFTCHPTVMTFDNLEITADYPGVVNRIVKGVLGSGTAVLFANGACGDINPARVAAVFPEVERIGTIVGAEAVRVLTAVTTAGRHVAADNLLWSERPALSFRAERQIEPGQLRARRQMVPLPLREFDGGEDEYQARITAGREKIAGLGLSDSQLQRIRQSALASGEVSSDVLAERRKITARLNYDNASLTALRRLENLRQTVSGDQWEVEIQAIQLGQGVTLVGVPGELMVELGERIRECSGKSDCLVVGYANDYIGYIVTPESVEEGGYESGTTILATSAGITLADAAARLAAELAS